jgi:hypothetical protein
MNRHCHPVFSAFIVAAGLAAATPSHAEGFATRGSWVALGEVSYDRDDFESKRGAATVAQGDRQKLMLAPVVGYFPVDGLLLEGGVSFALDRRDDRASTDSVVTVGLSVRPAYYFPIADALFVHAGLPVGAIVGGSFRNEDKAADLVREGSVTGWTAGVGGGLAYALGVDRGGFARLTLDYALQSLTYAPDTGTSTQVSQGALSLAVGFGAHF